MPLAAWLEADVSARRYYEPPQKASSPFDKGRDGFVIGEGADVAVLQELNHALDRNAHIYAELTSYGVSADADYLTAPLPDGDGALRAVKVALREARISARKVGYINAHATSTPRDDAAESWMIKALMADPGLAFHDINVSSTKGAIGHLLGGAGSVKAIFTALAVKNGVLPPIVNLEDENQEYTD